MMNIPVSNYNPTQRERFRKRLLLFYSVHDQEGSGRVNNALTLKIPEQMVMSSLYSKYNVKFELEEQAARQKGLLPEQQAHFNAASAASASPIVSDGSGASPIGGSGSNEDLFSAVGGSGNNMRNRAGTAAVVYNNSRNRGAALSQQNLQQAAQRSHAASLVIPPSHLKHHDSDFGVMQHSYTSFSAQPSMNIPHHTSSDLQQDSISEHQNNNNGSSPSSQLHRPHSGSVATSANITQQGSSLPSHPLMMNTNTGENTPVAQLPEIEKQRVQKRVDRFYKKYFPEGAWKAQEARSSPMTESDLFESLCSSYKVSQEEEKILAAELLPGTQGAAVGGVKNFYEEQLKKMEAQHQKQREEEERQKKELAEEKIRLAKEKQEHERQVKEAQLKLEREMREHRERMEKEAEDERLKRRRASLPPSPFLKPTELLSALPHDDKDSSTRSNSQAVEAQLAFLKNELDAAKLYTQALERCHKAEMDEKEAELLRRLQEKAALERKLTEEAQISPSRRDLLYGHATRRSHSKGGLFVDEDEDAPPPSETLPSNDDPSYSPNYSISTLNKSKNNSSPPPVLSLAEKRHRERIERAKEKYSSPQRFLESFTEPEYSPNPNHHHQQQQQQQQHTSPWSNILNKQYLQKKMEQTYYSSPGGGFAAAAPNITLSTPASPIRIRGHGSPEHPLLMVCGVCGEQGRDRFCHNCGANYSGIDYVPPS